METARTIAIDAYCLECRYNLRGLAVDGLCPECGTSIDLAMRARTGPTTDWNPSTGSMCLLVAAAGFSLVALALLLILFGAGYLSILLGPLGLMVDLTAIILCVQAMRTGRSETVLTLALIISALAVGLSALGAYAQLWLAMGA